MGAGGQVALVTGASRGIGRAIARALVGAGYCVFGTSRNPEEIPEKQRVSGVIYLPLEMTDYDSIDRVVREIGHVDVLIHNAGSSQIGPVEEASRSLVHHLFNLNLFGVIYLTRRLLHSMREKGGGTIINISSMAGRIVVPFSSIYAATKHGLDGYARGLRSEVREFNVRVVNVCPYGIRTGIEPVRHVSKDSPYWDSLSKVLDVRARASLSAPGPEVVADKVMQVLKRKNPRFSYVVGGIGPVLSFLNRVLPEKMSERIQRRAFKLD
jgi:NAD(P)-dependent dehydrogenase (short-subunit alcohol dehydrogenase family)